MRKLLSEASNGNLPESMLVNINTPDAKPLIRTVERDENNHIVRIIETSGE